MQSHENVDGPSPGAQGPAVLTTRECLDLLATHEVGRIGVVVGHYPLVVPVNDGLDRGVVVVRTRPGSLLTAAAFANVTFEVDDIDRGGHAGWSVLVRGTAEEVTDLQDDELLRRTLSAARAPWAAGTYDRLLRIVPHQITGRRVVPGAPADWWESAGYP